ncbi:MAG TPA: alpha/beta fold hydrolase, partial [Streptosporangiaceae bacterium]|nr:alpha/beta fold hydrolase [Streptosporangiaceae bacterium]
MTAIRWAWLVAPEPAARLRVTSSDGTGLNVEVHGPQDAPAPTVVLIHGWTCSIPLWSRVIYALRGDLRIAAYDQRGHGASEKGGRYSVDVLADDLAAVLDATLRPGEKAVLAGHSMGGMAIMAAAPREAVLSRVSGALLASTGYADLVPAARVAPRGRQFPRLAALAHRQL